MSRVPYQSFFFKVVVKILIFSGLFCSIQMTANGQSSSKRKPFTVVIDAGHGGKDPGAVANGVKEKNIVLSVALKLGNYIKHNASDVRVLFTRETDVFVELGDRAPVANRNKADLFISIHANYEKSTRIEGTETYAMGLAKTNENLEVAQKENAVILLEDDYTAKYEGYNPKSPDSFIIFSLLQNTHLDQSLHFASCVQSQFKDFGERQGRGVKQAGFLVLWKTTMPSVLIETGFISNPQEARYLASEHGQDKIAASIFKAFLNYKEDIEKHSVGAINHSVKESHIPNQSDKSDSAKEGKHDTLNKKQISSKKKNQEKQEKPEKQSESKPKTEFLTQICASKVAIPLKSKQFKGVKNIEEIKTDSDFKYAVGRNTSLHEVLKITKEIRKTFPGAFVIAVRDGKIIPVKDAQKEIKD